MESYETDEKWETLVEGVDEFYADFGNAELPVIWGLKAVSVSIRGVPPDSIESEVLRWRRIRSEGGRGEGAIQSPLEVYSNPSGQS